MRLFNFFQKKVVPLLSPDDVKELKELERKAYIEEARKLVVLKGTADAKGSIKIRDDVY